MSRSSSIQPIETDYSGHAFRSRTEAKWAVFFNRCDIQWYYEPEGLELDSGDRWLPDFYLKDVGLRDCDADGGLWVEVKPIHELEVTAALVNKLEAHAQFHGIDIALLLGQPGDVQRDDSGGHQQFDRHGLWDNCMYFMQCHNCNRVKFEFHEGNYMECDVCGAQCEPDHANLVDGRQTARRARFEYGEYPEV